MAAGVRWRSMPPECFVEVVDLDGLHAPGGVASKDVVPDFLVDRHEGLPTATTAAIRMSFVTRVIN